MGDSIDGMLTARQIGGVRRVDKRLRLSYSELTTKRRRNIMNHQLMDECARLTEENEELKKALSDLQKEYDALQSDYEELHEHGPAKGEGI
jgi:hypothetical protein